MSLYVDLPIKKISTEGGTCLRAALDQQAVNDISEALLSGEEVAPIVVYHHYAVYRLADGFHRLAGARSAGLTKISAEVRQGTLREAILHSVKAAAGQGCVRRTNADKRLAVAALLGDRDWSNWSDRKIAEVCGVHHDLVGRLRRELSGGNRQMGTTRTVRRNGREYQMDVTKIGAGRSADLAEARVAGNSGDSHAAPPDRALPEGMSAECEDFDYDGDEWYTPAPYVEAARRVFGGRIDLDVASNEAANSVIRAEQYFDKNQDALRQRWWGNVWMNPPYSTALINQFTAYAVNQYRSGHCESIIILVNNCTDTAWFQSLAAEFPLMFTRERVQFWRRGQANHRNRQGQAVFYLGNDVDAFHREFSDLAWSPSVTKLNNSRSINYAKRRNAAGSVICQRRTEREFTGQQI